MERRLTAKLTREGDWYVAPCREDDVASQGVTRSHTLMNLQEALELHFEPLGPENCNNCGNSPIVLLESVSDDDDLI